MNRNLTRNGRNNNGKECQNKGSYESSSRKYTTEYKKQVMEFTSHIAGKHQTVTYDTVKEHILQEIHTDLNNGLDMAVNIRKDIYDGIPINKPRRVICEM